MTMNELLAKAHAEALTRPDMGRKVRVVKGRKVPLGTEGVVVYNALHEIKVSGRVVKKDRRIGVKDAKGEIHFTSDTNVVVI